jgi:hypothetical protein
MKSETSVSGTLGGFSGNLILEQLFHGDAPYFCFLEQESLLDELLELLAEETMALLLDLGELAVERMGQLFQR